jgi:hypothetical protein
MSLRLLAGAGQPGEAVASGDPGGWDVVRLPVGDLWRLADQIAEHGPDVVAVEPPDLRDAVIRTLRGAAAARPGSDQPAPVAARGTGGPAGRRPRGQVAR